MNEESIKRILKETDYKLKCYIEAMEKIKEELTHDDLKLGSTTDLISDIIIDLEHKINKEVN